MNNLLLTMTLTGSIPLLLFVIIKRLPTNMNASKGYILLLISAFFYIIPIPFFFSYNLKRIFYQFWGHSKFPSYVPIKSNEIYEINDTVVFWERQNVLFYLILLLWIFGCSFYLLHEIILYQRLRRKIKQSCRFENYIFLPTLFWNRKVSVYRTDFMSKPFSTGFFHPMIVLPPKGILNDKEHLVLFHESIHIKNFDFPICWIAIIARSMHWFNPVSYLLLKNIKQYQEYIVDEKVIRRLDSLETVQYGQLILESSCSNSISFRCSEHISSLSSVEFANLKERVIRIKSMIKRKKSNSLIVVLTIIATVIINMFPILVYSAPIRISGEVTNNSEILSFDSNSYQNKADDLMFAYSENYFVSTSGECIPVTIQNITDANRISCKHSWVTGNLQKHVPHSDRSCDVMVYDAKRCIFCGAIEVFGLNNVIHYKVCPH